MRHTCPTYPVQYPPPHSWGLSQCLTVKGPSSQQKVLLCPMGEP